RLGANPYVNAFSEKILTGQLKTNGTLSHIELQNAALQWGDSTALKITGSIKNITNPDQLQYDLKDLEFKTDSTDIKRFISEKELGVSIPKTVALNRSLKGSRSEMYTKAQLSTSEGNIHLDGSFTNQDMLKFDAQLEVEKLQLSQLLQNEKLGPLSFTATVAGKGDSVNTLDATLSSDFKEFTYDSYDFSNLKLD